MYPLTCYAGYPMPLKVGKFEIAGYFAAPDVVTTNMEVAIVDDVTIKSSDLFGKIITSMGATDNVKTTLVREKVGAGFNASAQFAESIKIRNGISIYSTNVKGGSLCVYVR